MSHERSITIESQTGQDDTGGPFFNAYGPGNDTGAPVGQRLPGERDYSSPEPAVLAAEQRSGGIRPEVGGAIAPPALGHVPYSPVGAEASRLNTVLGSPERSLTPTLDTSPVGLQRAGEREPVRGNEPMSTEDYIRRNPDATAARVARDADPGNIELRNAEHFRFAQELRDKVGPLGATGAVLGYSAMKALYQGMPETGRAILKSLGVTLPATTDRPGEELGYGLKGIVTPAMKEPHLRGRFGK